jgi:2-polyprenyl-3-methyl-5-hydroxy-6-metoxy-1,4-benzoquinol methylase
MDEFMEVSEHFDKLAGKLARYSYRNDHTMNAVRLKIVLSILSGIKTGRLLDLGCGEAYTTNRFLDAGWDAYGHELSGALVEKARTYLKINSHDPTRICCGSATDLSRYGDESFDLVTCLGVAYYIKDQDAMYREVCRVLKPNGLFICSHQNDLFSLFTFNKYTVDFYRRNVFKDLVESDRYEKELRELLTRSQEPQVHQVGSARDSLQLYPENPLTIGGKLNSFGFLIERPLIYHGWHNVPPLIMGEEERRTSEMVDIDHTDDWRGLFMAAHFIFTATKRSRST